MRNVWVCGSFDNLRSREVRFLEEAAKFGPLHVLLWTDEVANVVEGAPPQFPYAEREYFLGSLRYVHALRPLAQPCDLDLLPGLQGSEGAIWAVREAEANEAKRMFCASYGIGYQVVREAALEGWPEFQPAKLPPWRKKVIVTGCYDWLHSGHVRFFEEASNLGALYVSVGNDANVRLLKGPGHPQFSQQERRYMVQAVRFVHQALIATGEGWMDAAPEIERLQPELYAVNEDGDKPEKREFCREHGLEYVVLQRRPKRGLPRRQSTDLRGF
jgi:cytidyltransferase-like protein